MQIDEYYQELFYRYQMLPCDICGLLPRDRWYKCLKCSVYNICHSCYDLKLSNLSHTPEHPMQCLVTERYWSLYFGGDALLPRRMGSFTCPVCGIMGLTADTLYDHLITEHDKKTTKVSCPICLSLPHVLVKRPPELIEHMNAKHVG